VPRFTFFVGKGGVGKTTVSSAYALHRAARERRARLLLISTDPAHSLADILQRKLFDAAKRLQVTGNLWARQIDAQRQIDRFLYGEREDILALLNKGSLFTSDELAPLLDTSLPGMAEVAALLAIHELLDSNYDEVVVDTAPMGHAIQLFQMPAHFARFLDVLETAASRDVVLARHFGGHIDREPALDRWARMVAQVEGALMAGAAKLVLVTTPEPLSLNQAARAAPSFESSGNRFAQIVLNRVVRDAGKCPRCQKRKKQSAEARRVLRKYFPRAQVFTGYDPGVPILGTEALRAFGGHVFACKGPPRSVLKKAPEAVPPELERTNWPRLETPLTLTIGKGGVGKTTVSAALAYRHRKLMKSDKVTICSIDPAPSLDDVFATRVADVPRPVLGDSKLLAAEFDAMAQFQEWSSQLRARLAEAMTGQDRGVHLDLSLDRKFLLALLDIVPPGVDEIFAIFRVVDLLRGGGRVVIDMAPTGHALEVLRTPERLLAWSRVLLKTLAAHRTLAIAQDAAVEIASLSQSVRELKSLLRDARRCRLAVVTLPEPLPDYETRRLMGALRELQAPVGALFVNRVLVDAGGCKRCELAAQWQAASLLKLRREHRSRTFIAPDFEMEITGAKALGQFTRQLWRPGEARRDRRSHA